MRPPELLPGGLLRQDCSSGSTTACELAALREENDELRARCEWQAQALRELRQRTEEAAGAEAALAPRGLPRHGGGAGVAWRLAPVPGRLCEQATQTDSAVEQLRMHEKQLAAAHQKAGEKTRELWDAQEQGRVLQKQLLQQEKLVSQYKEEISNLEEQLRVAIAKQHRAEDERTLAEQSSAQAQRSLRVAQAWGEVKADCGENSTRAPSPQSTMNTSSCSGCSRRPTSASRLSRARTPAKRWGSWQEDAAFEASSSSDEESVPCTTLRPALMHRASVKSQA